MRSILSGTFTARFKSTKAFTQMVDILSEYGVIEYYTEDTWTPEEKGLVFNQDMTFNLAHEEGQKNYAVDVAFEKVRSIPGLTLQSVDILLAPDEPGWDEAMKIAYDTKGDKGKKVRSIRGRAVTTYVFDE